MTLVDTHCHLQDHSFDADRAEVLERAMGALAWLVVVGDDLETSTRAVNLARERVYATVGVHPYSAERNGPELLEQLKGLACNEHVVAVGEIGLDYHYERASRNEQQAAFRAQLRLACELDLPVVVHNRHAHDDLGRILNEYSGQLAGGVMHCFDGDAAFAERCMGWGFFISFAGNVTFPNAHKLRDTARAVPMERLLVETDSPHLAPQPVRGKRCEPVFVRHTADALAALKGVPREVLAAQTTCNAACLFGVQAPVEAG